MYIGREGEREEGKSVFRRKKTGREREREVGKRVSIGETGVHREGGRERRGKEIGQRKREDVNIHSSKLINSWF